MAATDGNPTSAIAPTRSQIMKKMTAITAERNRVGSSAAYGLNALYFGGVTIISGLYFAHAI